jgi:hypothetical protein
LQILGRAAAVKKAEEKRKKRERKEKEDIKDRGRRKTGEGETQKTRETG